MDADEKRILRGVIFLIIGGIVVLVMIYPVISMFSSPYFSIYSILSLDAVVLGLALILIGIFSIWPVKTDEGRKGLGLTSIIFGIVLALMPIISMIVQISEIGMPYFFMYLLSYAFPLGLYLILGVALIVHGAFLIRRVNIRKTE
jgi:hypothetical protein